MKPPQFQYQARSPEAWWRLAAGGRDQIGTDSVWLGQLLAKARGSAGLSPWEQKFVADLAGRFEQFGTRTFVSLRQRIALDRIETRLTRGDVDAPVRERRVPTEQERRRLASEPIDLDGDEIPW